MFPGTLPDNAQDALALLGQSGILKNSYMAGGSALALHLGHRRSVDFDFFTDDKFDPIEFGNSLNRQGSFIEDQQSPDSIFGTFNGIKLSLFRYPYPLVSPLLKFQEVSLASPDDISAMKLAAVTGRSTKKDFVDIYFMAKKSFPIDHMLDNYDKKYQTRESNRFTIIKGLQYFEEAEDSEMPIMLEPIEWKTVKEFLRSETIRLWAKLPVDL